MKILTCQMSASRKFRKEKYLLLDITVKNGNGLFAPTWKMVMDYKKSLLSEEGYTSRYKQIMRNSYRVNKDTWESIISESSKKEGLVLICYCKKNKFCHRHLLKEYIAAVARKMGYEVEIIPED